ncbi:MAG: hypothetical protein LBH06_00005, partial [Rikenellaceae bacterium]|nr:hypothetical protein [Rikenellaceae bacterium]
MLKLNKWNFRRSNLVLLLRRLFVVYLLLMLCRTAFYIYNSQILGPIGRDELGSLLRGALTFDTVSVM